MRRKHQLQTDPTIVGTALLLDTSSGYACCAYRLYYVCHLDGIVSEARSHYYCNQPVNSQPPFQTMYYVCTRCHRPFGVNYGMQDFRHDMKVSLPTAALCQQPAVLNLENFISRSLRPE